MLGVKKSIQKSCYCDRGGKMKYLFTCYKSVANLNKSNLLQHRSINHDIHKFLFFFFK